MLPLIQYTHSYYIRSYRYIPPVLLYAVIIIWFYTVTPNPVMASYAFSSAALFAFSAWIAFGFIDAEHETQQALAAIHAGGLVRTMAVKMLYLWLFTLPFATLAVLYPDLLNKFDRHASGAELAAAFVSHLSLSLLGIAVAVFFTSRFVSKRSISIPGILTIIVLSLATGGIKDKLPDVLKSLTFLLPPIHLVVTELNQSSEQVMPSVYLDCGYCLLYAFTALAVFVWLYQRKGLIV